MSPLRGITEKTAKRQEAHIRKQIKYSLSASDEKEEEKKFDPASQF